MKRFLSRPRRERGAVAIMVAALAIVLFGVAALGVDIASQVNRKHLLKNQLDAAATAAAYFLDTETNGIRQAAINAQAYFAKNGQGTLDPSKIDFWCVVGRKLNGDNTPFNPAMVADYQIPSGGQTAGVCNPDAASSSTTWKQSDYQNRTRTWDGTRFSMSCSGTLCAVPCALQASPDNDWAPGLSIANNLPITCNTVRIGADQDVPFSFAPAIGIDKGSTGAQIAVACKGVCGAIAPNPMDVVVVADRTMSMKLGTGGVDYRKDVVTGIKGLLQVMTPEQQYVALGTIGPSYRTRSDAERACTNSSSTKGLSYPSTSEYVKLGGSSTTTGSWVPVKFSANYLSSPNSNGVRSLNANSNLVKAIDCLDDYDASSTHTALASPLKSAARYLLGRSGDENNIESELHGSARPGGVKKIIIFETDGQPWEYPDTTSAASLSLDNNNDVFSNYQDGTTSDPTSSTAPVGNAVNGKPSSLSPAPPSPYNRADNSTAYPSSFTYNRNNYTISYKYRTQVTTRTTTTTTTGGQNACANFQQVAENAKAAGIIIIAVGYNMSGFNCGDENPNPSENSSTATSTPWISDISPTACRDSSAGRDGSQAHPYVIRTSCARTATVTFTVPQTKAVTQIVKASPDPRVTDVLASAASPKEPGVPSTSNGCATSTQIAQENTDGDFFFCAARGDDLAPIFITALSQVSHGVKLMNLPK